MFRTLYFPRETTTATRNSNMQRDLATSVSADKGSLERVALDVSGYTKDCHVYA